MSSSHYISQTYAWSMFWLAQKWLNMLSRISPKLYSNLSAAMAGNMITCRLGGMHTLIIFVGAIATLMADTGLERIMNVAF